MPAVSMRMLTGDDGVDCWSKQSIWDAALQGMKVIFSTHAVLADALTHGFIKLPRLALLIFDEEELGCDLSCPLAQREELSEHTSQQKLTRIAYSQFHDSANLPPFLKKLDEFVEELREDSEFRGYVMADEHFKLLTKARMIWHQLGTWASRFFLVKVLHHITVNAADHENQPSRRCLGHRYLNLLTALRTMTEVSVQLEAPGNTSNKVERLLFFLKERACADFSGIIFARERVTAHVLSALLNTHPVTRGLFQCVPCVGSSARSEPWAIYDSVIPKKGEDVVEQFRCGKSNLIVATNVLEEGIDLPACHLVISFEIPDTITSYIQRRGRARQSTSEFAIMEEKDDAPLASREWNRLENAVQGIFLDHARSNQKWEVDDGGPEDQILRYLLDTGALLTTENAIPHLYHFCATLRGETSDETTPSFSYQRNQQGHFLSTVYLPSGVDPSVRIATGHHWWATKKSARRDAAFQAVRVLHDQELLNDHFLPLFFDDSGPGLNELKVLAAELPLVENFTSFWNNTQGQWTERKMYRCCIEVLENGEARPALAMALFTSVKLPMPAKVDLYWDDQTTFTARLQQLNQEVVLSLSLCRVIRRITAVLLHSTRERSTQGDYTDFLPFFTPDLPLEELEDWLKIYDGSLMAESRQNRIHLLSPEGFVRSPALHFIPHIFRRWIRDPDSKGLSIECRRFERRRNLIQRAILTQHKSLENPSRAVCIVAAECTIDLLPWELSQTSLLIPPMIQLLHRQLMAQALRLELFEDAPEISLDTLAEAITTPSSRWTVNYQRLEFLGDSLLKFIVSTHLFYKHPQWHEGYLSKQKDLLVSNERLTHAAITAHLEQFICKDFITRKHRAFWPKQGDIAREMIPKKVYADVVEALVAAAYEHGGLPLSRKLVGIFLPELSDFASTPKQSPKQNGQFPVHLEMKLDAFLGYKFTNRSLLWEALTHPSWQRDQSTSSYQRLEFLGDAVLDVLVAKMLHSLSPKLAEGRMTELRAALVNADFLAFLCMESAMAEPSCPIVTADSPETFARAKNIALWMFMRHDSPDIAKLWTECAKRHGMLGEVVKKKLEGDDSYPWGTLAQLGAPKFYSDLVESTIGAIFIESKGCLETCGQFLKRIHLVDYLQRFVRQNVRLEHPKSALNRITGTDEVKFEIEDTADGLHKISVWLKSEKIASIDSCFSRAEAFVRGADEAVVLLLSRTRDQ
ncbi:ATP-dependent helicase dcl2 [Penicillium brevicompactum]|uniref:ATP-dependent helicase dcl2 n=1 Tax=Penicillium brevicompactum TaxID=5074 RepID=UPI002542250B|nr:ATP-dependent helicase dcl2 [Penicillium brevicompactum]KAJ5335732.1 ATP-dependent helicase dcl2 [Penicillium brevicompactum]